MRFVPIEQEDQGRSEPIPVGQEIQQTGPRFVPLGGGFEPALIPEQFKSGVAGLQEGYYATTAKNNAQLLNMMDRIDRGEQIRPIDDVLGYADMDAETRRKTRDAIQSAMTSGVAKTISYGAERQGYKRNENADLMISLADEGNLAKAWEVFKQDPTGIIQQLSVESAPNALPSLIGGAAGVLLKGGVGGLMTGLATGSFPVEYMASITDSLRESGVDLKDAKAVDAKLRDPKFLEEAGKRAMTRGMVIASADAASGKLLMPFKAGQLGKNAARGVANIGTETGLEMTGEAAAQAASAEEIKLGQVIAEGLGAGPQATVGTVLKTVSESAKPAEPKVAKFVPISEEPAEPQRIEPDLEASLRALLTPEEAAAEFPFPPGMEPEQVLAPEGRPEEAAPEVAPEAAAPITSVEKLADESRNLAKQASDLESKIKELSQRFQESPEDTPEQNLRALVDERQKLIDEQTRLRQEAKAKAEQAAKIRSEAEPKAAPIGIPEMVTPFRPEEIAPLEVSPPVATPAAPVTPEALEEEPPAATVTPPVTPKKPDGFVLQNRDRSTIASISQMNEIASAPNYGMVGFSRDFAVGAPVVSGAQIPEAFLGKTDYATTSDGRRFSVQYAVVPADSIVTSNDISGSINPLYTDQEALPVDQGLRAIAGNGRVTGLSEAYKRGTAEQYKQELLNDDLHGINPTTIQQIPNPVLVRVMPWDKLTSDIGDVSNTTGVAGLSAVEQANNDVNRVDFGTLDFYENGEPTAQAVKSFVQAMPVSEQAQLLDTNGEPTAQAVDRFRAALFARAYADNDLIRMFAQAQDSEARLVISALAQLSPDMARLEGLGALDIRPIIIDAAKIIIAGKRKNLSLQKISQQTDITVDPATRLVVDLFAQNPRSNKAAIESIRNATLFAYQEGTKESADMFGEVPRASRQEVLERLRRQDEQAGQEIVESTEGGGATPSDVGGTAVEPGTTEAPRGSETSTPTGEAGPFRVEEPVADESTRAGATAPTTTGVQVQPSRIGEGPEVQPDVGQVGAGVGRDGRVEDQGAVREPSPEDRRRADMERDLFRLTPSGQMAPTAGVQGDLFGATGQLAPTPQLQRRKNSNTEQLSLYLDSDPDPSQPDSQDAKAAAVEAVEQLQETNNPLAMQLADELANRQVTMLVGKPARTPEDMAILAQVYRDNRFETTRLFFTDKDGKIVSQLGLTSRMPASAPGMLGSDPSAFVDTVMDAAKAKGATGYFMVHNHPSGAVEFSGADIRLTQLYASRFTQLQFNGHIVIDTNKYGVILPDGTVKEVSKDFGEKPFKGQQGEFGQIKSVNDAAQIAKSLETDEGDITLIALNIRGNVMQVSTIPATVAKDTNKSRLRRNMQKMVLRARGNDLIVVGRDRQALENFIGMAKDIVEITPEGQVKSSWNIGNKIFGADRTARVAAATSPEFNYLKSESFRAPPIPGVAEPGVEEDADSYPYRKNIFGKPMKATWEDVNENYLDNLIYKGQDKNIYLKRVQEAIQKTGKIIEDAWNPYLKEELSSARIAKESKDFLFDEADPAVQEMIKNNISMTELENFLHNMHAKDRNAVIRKRDPKNYPDGGSGLTDKQVDEYFANLDPNRAKVLRKVADKWYKIMKEHRQSLVDAGLETQETVDAWEETFGEFYVPLNRAEGDYELQQMGAGVGQGIRVSGPASKSAVGSDKPVQDILANILMQRERTIIRAEKARVGRALFGLVLQNPNPNFWLAVDPDAEANPQNIEQFRETMIAMGFNENSPEITEITELMSLLMQQPRIRALGPEPKKLKSEIKKLSEQRDALVRANAAPEQIKFIQDQIDPLVDLVNETGRVFSKVNLALVKSPFAIPVRVNGREKYIFFNPQNPAAKKIAEALNNIGADQLGDMLGYIAKITRYFAMINTQYNPLFGPINFLRDIGATVIQLESTPLKGKQKEVMAKVLPNLVGIYDDLRARRKGQKSTNPIVKDWDRLQKLGGNTGYRDMFSKSEERANAIYKILNPDSWADSKMGRIFTIDGRLKVPLEVARKSVAKPLFDWLSDYNETLENAVRVAVFQVAMEQPGMTEDRAASIAKNITVNFNRKGEIGQQVGALYAFFGASVQGTARMATTLFRRSSDGKVTLTQIGKRVFQGGLLLGAVQAMIFAAAGFDDDEPQQFIRERNLVIPLPGGGYFSIPYPLGYNVIPNTSRVLTEWALSGFKDTPKRIESLIGSYLDMFNPIGNAGLSLQTLSPTMIDPIAALAENKDAFGRSIAKEDFSSLSPTPGYTRARDTASGISMGISKFLNLATGGDKDVPGLFSPTPDQIDYLIGQLTGGVGREILKTEQTVRSAFTGEELPPYKIPLVGRFYGETTGQTAVRNKFYANLLELNLHESSIKGRRDRGENVQEYFRENPEARLYKMADKIQRNVSELRKRREMLLEKGASKEQIKAIENQITLQMQRLNESVERVKK